MDGQRVVALVATAVAVADLPSPVSELSEV